MALTASWIAAGGAAVNPRDRRLSNGRAGISVEAPAGWALSQHTGYADTIALLLHPDGSRISVTATTTTATSGNDLLQANRPGLDAEGLAPSPARPGPGGSTMVDLTLPKRGDHPQRMRQLYLVRAVPAGHQGIILTLVCRTDVFESRVPALDFVIARLALEDPAPTTGSTRSPASAGGHGGSAH